MRLSPLTRKRLRHFRANRRAWLAFCLLAGLYGLSLFANLLCNDRPLYLEFQGRRYFPLLRRYTLHNLLGNGEQTRVDYVALVRSPAFATNPANRVVFPPVPWSPGRIMEPAAYEDYRRARLILQPEAASGRFNLSAEGAITRPEACEPFFPDWDGLPESLVLSNHWEMPPALATAVRLRFADAAAPAVEVALAHRTVAGLRAVFALPAYAPRGEPPRSVRIALRAAGGPAAPLSLRFAASGRDPAGRLLVRPRQDGAWRSLPESARRDLLELAQRAYAGETLPSSIAWGGGRTRVTCLVENVSWPYRPVPGHWLGLDSAGRDVLARVVYGLRTSLTFGLLLVAWAMLLGFAAGAVQGYFGGWVDIAGQRLIEVWSALPFLYVMILIGAVLGRSFTLLLICYGLFNWIGLSYYIRAEFLRLRHRPFVEAALCQGLSHGRIIVRHILPNALTPMITLFPFQLIGAVASLAALDYLGFGLPPLTPSWGELLQQAQQYRAAWWLILYPSLALFVVMILTVVVGEGLRDAFDPRPRSRQE
jgi:microcin C transport system permease protein